MSSGEGRRLSSLNVCDGNVHHEGGGGDGNNGDGDDGNNVHHDGGGDSGDERRVG